MVADGMWVIERTDGEPVNDQYTFIHGGSDEFCDWVWCDEDEFWDRTDFVATWMIAGNKDRRTYGASCEVDPEDTLPVVAAGIFRCRWCGSEWDDEDGIAPYCESRSPRDDL